MLCFLSTGIGCNSCHLLYLISSSNGQWSWTDNDVAFAFNVCKRNVLRDILRDVLHIFTVHVFLNISIRIQMCIHGLEVCVGYSLPLQETLDMRLQQRQARETGICPVRRELYSQTFDELIRQITIECAERGLLLLRCVHVWGGVNVLSMCVGVGGMVGWCKLPMCASGPSNLLS